ncbi:MAG TPA: LLM class flavin-dependent oxidoreductase [Pseudolabrys sp.]|jgi:5,10-methylenetetrahydromethanopterin reductase|nr:LLM class flavin-dependent oxidoreductase [Pseudolabrys sp.]
MERLGFCFLDRPSTAKQIELVQKIEKLGFESAWVTETRLARDAFSVLGAFAAVTKRIQLCTGIVNSWTRGPALMAMTLATLDELAPNRVICGLGAYWDPLAWKQGIERSKPIEQMREYLTALRRLLNLEEFTYEGQFVKLRDISLDLGHGAKREPKNVKLYIGPTGPVMTQLAGEIADGALFNGLLSPAYTRGMVEWVKKGAAKVNRSLDTFEQPQLINISMSDDEKSAREVSRYLVTKYLGQQPHIGKAAGLDPELLERINKTMGGWPARPGGIEDAMKLVSNEVTDSMTISGNVTKIKDRMNEWLDAGITYPIILPLSENYDEMVDKLAPGKW